MIRDPRTNALLERDTIALDKYRQEKQRIQQIEQLRRDVAALQSTVQNVCKVLDRIIEEK